MEEIFNKLEKANKLKQIIDRGNKRLESLRKSVSELMECDGDVEVPVKDSITNRQVFFNLNELRTFYALQLKILEYETAKATVALSELLT